MVPPVADAAGRSRLAEIAELLAPSSEKWEFALRQAATCALVVLVCVTFDTPEPALTAYLVFFLTRPDRVSGIVLDLAGPILMAVVIGLLILTAREVLDRPMARVACMAGVSYVLLFLGSASKLKPVGATLAMIAGYVLDLLGSVPAGEIATRAFLWAWLFIGIPAGVSIAVNLVAAPAPRRLAERAIARRLGVAAEVLRRPEPRTRAALAARLDEGEGEIPAALRLAGLEHTSPAAELDALRRAATSTLRLLAVVEVATRGDEPALSPARRAAVADLLDEAAAIVASGRLPVEIEPPELADEATDLARAIADEIAAILRGFAERPLDQPAENAGVDDVRPDDARIGDIRTADARTGDVHADAAGVDAAAAGGAGDRRQVDERRDGPRDGEPKSGFFVADAFTAPDHVRHAVKTTAAAMSCYLFFSIVDWPGIHTCFITCYVVSLGTAAETIEKLTLRIVGALIGAAAGIAAMVWIVPSLTSIGGLTVMVFVVALVASLVAASGPRVGYAGYQIAFAFFLCVIQGSGPSFDMVVARDRIVGILLGNLVCWFVFARIWPIGVAARVDPAIVAVSRRLRDLAGASHRGERLRAAAAALAGGGAVGRDLALVAYEPPTLRPDAAWVAGRARLRDRLVGLAGPLLLMGERDGGAPAAVAARLDRLASSLEAAPVSARAVPDDGGEAPAPAPDAVVGSLADLVEAGVAAAERGLADLLPREVDHAPA